MASERDVVDSLLDEGVSLLQCPHNRQALVIDHWGSRRRLLFPLPCCTITDIWGTEQYRWRHKAPADAQPARLAGDATGGTR